MRTLPRTLAGAAAVVVVGFALGRYGSAKTTASPPPLDRQGSVATFSVRYPSSWHVVPPRAVPLVPLDDVLALAADRAERSTLVIGTQQPGAPTMLPPRLAAAVPPPTKPQVVALSNESFYRYLNLSPQGQHVAESVYTLATTGGTVTAVCSAPRFSERFTSGCERILSTIKLTSGQVVSLNVDPGYAFALNRILGPLNQVRRSAGPRLRSGRVSDRVHAASALAAAHAQAAAAATRIAAGRAGAANKVLVTALSRNASAYRHLARAASRGDVPAYGRARTALAVAQSGLDAAYSRLRQLGYVIS